MKNWIIALCCTFALTMNALAFSFGEDVFKPTVSYADGIVTVKFNMCDDPAKHIYDDMLSCTLGAPISTPAKDHVDEDGRVVYEGLATFTYAAPAGKVFTISYQGCDAMMCHMPQDTTFTVMLDGVVLEGEQELPIAPVQVESTTAVGESTIAVGESTTAVGMDDVVVNETTDSLVVDSIVETSTVDVETVVNAFPTVEEKKAETGTTKALDFPAATRTISGYYNVDEFLSFLKGEEALTFASNPIQYVKEHGIWLMILLIFIGGFALNLTPCVLPMIPINLAIIGAGAAGGSRSQGALRGGAYGLGIALAYGSLGLVAALTGTAFGTIQATWWFNLSIAIVFIALALALFDVFMIDFTRFSQGGNSKQGTIAAFVAGVMSAILAGACVAPVLIAVLLLTSSYFNAGHYAALLLPFVLGLGMALPWPFAGAGLSFLPKPGAWMAWVKKIFGAVVILFALYYGYTAWKILSPTEHMEETTTFDAATPQALIQAINNAHAEGKTVVIDVWGPACKACEKMEKTTFQDEKIKAQLETMAFFKVRMDLSDTHAIKPMRDAYQISGLPTFIVIEPLVK